ncbi:HEAT repeat-containing protein 6 [Nymphaea thermarum]|nr:HEAT repeat-containing protein 6 [Nymphaea thermarum]
MPARNPDEVPSIKIQEETVVGRASRAIPSSMDVSRVRSWRTAFLTLRDEAATSTSIPSVLSLLRNLASQSEIIVLAASNLPSREVALDVMLLVELGSSVPVDNDTADTFVQICHLIYDISCQKQLELNSNCCILMFGFIEKVVECLNSYTAKRAPMQQFDLKRTLSGALHIIGELVNRTCGNWSLHENSQLVKVLLRVVSFLREHLSTRSYAQAYRDSISTRTKINQPEKLWEIQSVAFSMLGDAFLRTGSSFPNDVWQSTLEVASFVAALKMFFTYGLSRTSLLSSNAISSAAEHVSSNWIPRLEDSTKSEHGHYRPPHLRKREKMKMQPLNDSGSESFLPSTTGYTTSDSEQSDNDGQSKIADRYRSSKARTAAMICLQDLAQADPKSLISQWSMILPTNDVLRQWSYQPTLMTSLLFDPVMKTRMAAASALAAILDGSSSLLLQIAEYKEAPRCSSFTTLSSSLGQIVVQLHSGLLYLVQNEAHSGLLASLFKVLMFLVSTTPYARMPGKLLPTVIATVHARAQELCSAKNEETSLVAAAISCLGVAFSISPPSVEVMELLKEEISTGKSGLIASLFQFAEAFIQPNISFEAFQALKSLLHNYPSIISTCWDKISTLVMEVIQLFGCESPTLNSSKGDPGNVSGAGVVKCIVAAIKVLDEFLRAASGFKGMDDHLDDKLFETFAEFPRRSKVSSAPFFQQINVIEVSEENHLLDPAGSSQWNEAIEKHLPPMLLHANATVSLYSIASTFNSTSSINYLLLRFNLIRIFLSHNGKAEICSFFYCIDLGELVGAVEVNTRDELVSVKANAVRALGNLSSFLDLKGVNYLNLDSCSMGHTSLREAEGSPIPRSMDSSYWLEKVVQTFVSCVTTGNVKVQWNVCHALANLFQNETLLLRAMPWAPSVYSILLLLIRDSSNFKIRIHAASALAVPGERSDYGDSFADVLQGLVHVLEILNSDQVIMPSSLKYRDALEEQLGSTTMHVLRLTSPDDPRPVKDFLLKKASFLEAWFESMCKSVAPIGCVDQDESHASARRKVMVVRSLRSLIQLYVSCNSQNLAEKFRRLENCYLDACSSLGSPSCDQDAREPVTPWFRPPWMKPFWQHSHLQLLE